MRALQCSWEDESLSGLESVHHLSYVRGHCRNQSFLLRRVHTIETFCA